MIFSILFLTLDICSSERINNELNSTIGNEVPEAKNLHQGTPHILITLGASLKEHLSNPVVNDDLGKEIIEDLFKYYSNLRDVLDMLKSEEDIEKRLGMKLFKDLYDVGGPPHMDENFDMEDAMAKYCWNNRAVFTVRKVLDETDILWQDIQLEVEKSFSKDDNRQEHQYYVSKQNPQEDLHQ